MRASDTDIKKSTDRLVAKLQCVIDAVNATDANTDPVTIDNRHTEVVDTGTFTITGASNYSYSVISGTAEVTINGVTLTGVPAGFDARQGDTEPDALANNITITGESLGTRVIIYYELA